MSRFADIALKIVTSRLVRGGVIVALVGVAGVVLWREATGTDWAAVGQSLTSYGWPVLALSLLTAAISYCALAAYETIAAAAVAPRLVSHRFAGLAGAAVCAITNLTGHAYIVGVALRARIYGGRGISTPQAVAITAFAGLGFWLGLALVLGGLLLVHPDGIFTELGWSRALDAMVGLALWGAVGLVVILAGSGRTITLWRWRIDLPARRHVLGLIVAGGVDLLGVSLTLYLLMPPDIAGNFPAFFATFAAALGLGILSATPGGIGVFEATLLLGLGVPNRPDMVAALAAYRVVYFLIPFIIAGTGLAIAALIAMRKRPSPA